MPAVTASRRMSPVAIFGSPCVRANRSDCVPLPAPGGPSITTFSGFSAVSGRWITYWPRRPRIRVFFMNPS